MRKETSRHVQHLIGLSVSVLVLTGCVGPLVEEFEIDEEQANLLRTEVPTVNEADLQDRPYKNIGTVSATSCFNNFITDKPASKDHALDQLRYKVDRMGGNALLNPSCHSEGTSVVTNCWSSITCSGWALRIGEVDGEPQEDAKGSRSGTCFFVSDSGAALTSAHVVSGASNVIVTTADGRQLPATIEQLSRSTDIAALRVEGGDFNSLPLSSSQIAKSGDRVFTLGYPATDILGLELKFTDGSVSALSGVGGEASLMQITVPVQPGNSGGPLVTESGNVIGVIASTAAVETFYRATGSLPQNINWAVKSDFAAPIVQLPIAPAKQLSRDEAIAQTKAAVCRVEATM